MKAVLFDVDDTLYHQVSPFEKAYDEVFGVRFALSVEKLFAASRRRSDEVFELSQSGKISMEEMYIYRIQKAFADMGETITDEEALRFQKHYGENQRHITLPETVAAMLARLREREVPTGIITNGPTEHQWDKVRALGLTRWILPEHVFVSEACGCAKPEPEIFAYAQQALGLTAEECCYVGDSYVNDVLGAKRAGWSVIWVRRRGPEPAAGQVQPDFTVRSDEEMEACIAKLFA